MASRTNSNNVKEEKVEAKKSDDDSGEKDKSDDANSINLSEFFDFLSCAYQLNIDLVNKEMENSKIDWDKLTTNGLLSKLIGFHQNEMSKIARERGKENNHKETNGLPSRNVNGKIGYIHDPKTNFTAHNLIVGSIQDYLNSKVENVLDEGLLDSIMPFMVPKINGFESVKKPNHEVTKRINLDLSNQQNNSHEDQSKPYLGGEIKDVEIDIQVCDEIRHKTKMFKCPRDILLSKMQYFADVTSGQKLEDMDISVHCDLTIFEWLMKWVKSGSTEPKPVLVVQNVVQVLVSATFLQMEPLISECISFFRENADEVIRTASSNLSCLNDAVISKIAEALSNIEVDAMNDPKDKMKSRLFCKLIMSLANKSQNPCKGHFSSISYLFKCSLCEKILHYEFGHFLPCLPKNIKLNTSGNMVGIHEVDETWSLNNYVKELKTELKSWRKVYWKLWGRCHYLKCAYCSCYYSVCYTNWCRYHEQYPQFFTSEEGKCAIVGTYMCCGAKTYRFEILPTPSGCIFRPHRPQLDAQLRQVLFILEVHSKLICINPPKANVTTIYTGGKNPELLTDGNDTSSETIKYEYFWWHELELSQNTTQSSLHKNILPQVFDDDHEDADDVQDNDMMSTSSKNATNVTGELGSDICSTSDEMDSSSIDEDDISDEDSPTQTRNNQPRRKKRYHSRSRAARKAQYTKKWLPKLSVRCNQDNQREKEERIMKCYVQRLAIRSGNSSCSELTRLHSNHSLYSRYPSQDDIKSGGIYAQLEQEWKESIKQPTSPKKRTGALKLKIPGRPNYCS